MIKFTMPGHILMQTRSAIIAVCLMAVAGHLAAQDRVVRLTARTLAVGEAFRQIEAQTGYTIVYNETRIDPAKEATLVKSEGTTREILAGLLAGTGQAWNVTGSYIVLKAAPKQKSKPAAGPAARHAAAAPEEVQGMAIPAHNGRIVVASAPIAIPEPSFGIKTNHFADVAATVTPAADVKREDTAAVASAVYRIGVTKDAYAIEGERVVVEMTFDMNDVKVPAYSFLLLTPIMKSGDIVMSLPAAVVTGDCGDGAYGRLDTLHRGPANVQVAKDGDGKTLKVFKYATAVAYEPWMSEAELLVREDQRKGNRHIAPRASVVLADMIEDRNPPPAPDFMDVPMNFAVSFKVPHPEPVKSRSESGKAFLDFKIGRSEINPDLGNNAAELEKIGEMIRSVKNNRYATVTGIAIEGWASPDGSAAANQRLSAARAASLRNHIQATYGFPSKVFGVAGKGEDWATLERAIEESEAPRKEQALAIVRNGKPLDTRERELKALDGGNTFRQLSAEVFPGLRRSDYRLDYTIVPFTVEQGRQVIKTAPANLSLNEMFMVAQSFEQGSAEYNEVFRIAAVVYPDSDIANLNEAANALARGDADAAGSFMQKVAGHDAAWENNMGVLAALAGNYEKAASHFAKAKEEGNAQAAANMGEIEKLRRAQEEQDALAAKYAAERQNRRDKQRK